MAKNRRPKQVQKPKSRNISQEFNPDSYFNLFPSWKYSYLDKKQWTIFSDNESIKFCSEVLPHLADYERQRWSEIKSHKKQNHSIDILDLNKCAQSRLEDHQIEAEALFSLRITGTIRVYGMIEADGSFNIIWVDFDHGDNSACVCRSNKKHT